MADLSPAELAKLDQIHSAVMDRLTALVSSAVDDIRTEGEPFTASSLAGQAQGTDHTSVATLLAAALIRLARHQIADEKRRTIGESVRTEQRVISEHWWKDGETDSYSYTAGTDGEAEAYALSSATDAHEALGHAYTLVRRITETTYRTAVENLLELGTKPEATP